MSKESTTLSRRDLLKSAVSGVAVFGGMAVITACGGEGKKPEPEMKKEEPKKEEPMPEAKAEEKPAEDMAANTETGDPCSDLSDVEDDEINKRNNIFKYQEKSEKEGQNCANCQLYKKPEAEGDCGGCTLFAGPVQTGGWCPSWAKASA